MVILSAFSVPKHVTVHAGFPLVLQRSAGDIGHVDAVWSVNGRFRTQSIAVHDSIVVECFYDDDQSMLFTLHGNDIVVLSRLEFESNHLSLGHERLFAVGVGRGFKFGMSRVIQSQIVLYKFWETCFNGTCKTRTELVLVDVTSGAARSVLVSKNNIADLSRVDESLMYLEKSDTQIRLVRSELVIA